MKEDIIGLDGYRVKSNEYNCLWLFQHLKSNTFGAERSQYEYFSYVRDLISLMDIHQQDNESTEDISERIDSVLLNLKLVCGNMHPEGSEKKKDRNSTNNDEDNYVTVEDKLMGILLIESSNDKKYRDLKR